MFDKSVGMCNTYFINLPCTKTHNFRYLRYQQKTNKTTGLALDPSEKRISLNLKEKKKEKNAYLLHSLTFFKYLCL